jgi:hypothetical protein
MLSYQHDICKVVYCIVFGVFGPFASRVYVTYHFWTPICNLLGCWRHCPICYTSLFTTSLVVTTISVYNVLGPSDVVSRSGPGSASLIAPLISLLCLSSLCVCVCVCLLSVWLFSLCPFTCCPSNRVFVPERRHLPPRFHIPLLRFPTIWLLRNS